MTNESLKATSLKFDVFGFEVTVRRGSECWEIYHQSGDGKTIRVRDFVIPAELNESEIMTYLDDMFHERATAENPRVVRIE